MSDQPTPTIPPDYLQEQIELLKVLNQYQKALLDSQEISIKSRADWLKLAIEEQRKQTSYLKIISIAAIIYIILFILGACIIVFNLPEIFSIFSIIP
jgi:hypothetical protein